MPRGAARPIYLARRVRTAGRSCGLAGCTDARVMQGRIVGNAQSSAPTWRQSQKQRSEERNTLRNDGDHGPIIRAAATFVQTSLRKNPRRSLATYRKLTSPSVHILAPAPRENGKDVPPAAPDRLATGMVRSHSSLVTLVSQSCDFRSYFRSHRTLLLALPPHGARRHATCQTNLSSARRMGHGATQVRRSSPLTAFRHCHFPTGHPLR